MDSCVQGLWIGRSLSTMERLSITSFIKHGHDYHLYVYDDVGDVPPKTVLKDANEILPVSMIFQYRDYASYAGFSNYFRYKLLLEKGGWWADLDNICIKPLDFNDEYVFASEMNEIGSEVVCSGVIKAPKGSEIMNDAWSACCSKDPQTLKWGEIGPSLMQHLVGKYSFDKYVKSYTTFCPIPFNRFYEILLPGRWVKFDEQTYTVHLWNEFWRRFTIDKDEEYAPRCLYEHLKKLYAMS